MRGAGAARPRRARCPRAGAGGGRPAPAPSALAPTKSWRRVGVRMSVVRFLDDMRRLDPFPAGLIVRSEPDSASGPHYRIDLLRCSIRRLTYMRTADSVPTCLGDSGNVTHVPAAGPSAFVHFFAPHTGAILLIRPIRRAG